MKKIVMVGEYGKGLSKEGKPSKIEKGVKQKNGGKHYMQTEGVKVSSGKGGRGKSWYQPNCKIGRKPKEVEKITK